MYSNTELSWVNDRVRQQQKLKAASQHLSHPRPMQPNHLPNFAVAHAVSLQGENKIAQCILIGVPMGGDFRVG